MLAIEGKYKRFTLRLETKTYQALSEIAAKNGELVASYARILIAKGIDDELAKHKRNKKSFLRRFLEV